MYVLEEIVPDFDFQFVNLAKGETARYTAILKEYKRAREVTRRRMYLETMQEVLPKVEQIYVVDKDQKSILPLLNLNQAQNK